MKNFQTAFLFVLLAAIPCRYASAQQAVSTKVGDDVMLRVKAVGVAPRDAKAVAGLVDLLKNEIRMQGLDKISSITATIMSSAADSDSARALAEAVTTAAILVGKELRGNLSHIVSAVGEGLVTGAPAAVRLSAVNGAIFAITANVPKEQIEDATVSLETSVTTTADARGSSASEGSGHGAGNAEIIVPDAGDAGDTPSADISTGSGVGD